MIPKDDLLKNLGIPMFLSRHYDAVVGQDTADPATYLHPMFYLNPTFSEGLPKKLHFMSLKRRNAILASANRFIINNDRKMTALKNEVTLLKKRNPKKTKEIDFLRRILYIKFLIARFQDHPEMFTSYDAPVTPQELNNMWGC